jgi:hypothetical protein
VVRHVDDRLVRTAGQLGLVLDAEHNHLLSVLLLRPGRVHDARLNGARETLVTVRADERELDALAALELASLKARHALDADGLGAVPDLLAPPDIAAVQVVGPVVSG